MLRNGQGKKQIVIPVGVGKVKVDNKTLFKYMRIGKPFEAPVPNQIIYNYYNLKSDHSLIYQQHPKQIHQVSQADNGNRADQKGNDNANHSSQLFIKLNPEEKREWQKAQLELISDIQNDVDLVQKGRGYAGVKMRTALHILALYPPDDLKDISKSSFFKPALAKIAVLKNVGDYKGRTPLQLQDEYYGDSHTLKNIISEAESYQVKLASDQKENKQEVRQGVPVNNPNASSASAAVSSASNNAPPPSYNSVMIAELGAPPPSYQSMLRRDALADNKADQKASDENRVASPPSYQEAAENQPNLNLAVAALNAGSYANPVHAGAVASRENVAAAYAQANANADHHQSNRNAM